MFPLFNCLGDFTNQGDPGIKRETADLEDLGNMEDQRYLSDLRNLGKPGDLEQEDLY